MAEIRDDLILDIDQALRQVAEIEQALNRALSDIVLNINTAGATTAAADVTTSLGQAEQAAQQLSFFTDDIDDNLRQAATAGDAVEQSLEEAEDAARGLARESKQVETGLDRAKGSARSLGGELKTALASGFGKDLIIGAVAAVGARELVQGFAAAVDEASKLNESINAVNVVFGEAADQVLAFGADTSDAVFLAASEFNQLATSTGNLLQGFGIGVQDAADLTTQLTERAADLASVFDTEVSVALEAINAALRGETEQIRRFTGSFSIDEVKTFGRELFGVTGELTSQQQALAAVELIMTRTAAVQGDAANTAGEFANQQRALNEQWKNAQATIGAALIPALESAIPLLLDLIEVGVELTPVLSAVVDVLAEGVDQIVEFAGPLLDIVSALADLADKGNDVKVAGIGIGDALGFAKDRAIDFGRYGLAAPVTLGSSLISFLVDLGDTAEATSTLTGAAFESSADAIIALGDGADTATGPIDYMAESVDRAEQAFLDAAQGANELDGALTGSELWEQKIADLPDTIGAIGREAGISAGELLPFGEAFAAAAEGANDFRLATLELADPVFAAVSAQERLAAAEKARADLDPAATAQEQADAEFDVAKAALEADAALRGLGDINLVGGPFDRSISVISAALGVSRDVVLDLLEDANVLDQTAIGPKVEFLVDDDELNDALSGVPSEITVGIRYVANNFMPLPTPGEIDAQVGNQPVITSSSGVTVNINNPTDADIKGNASQAGAIIGSIPGLL